MASTSSDDSACAVHIKRTAVFCVLETAADTDEEEKNHHQQQQHQPSSAKIMKRKRDPNVLELLPDSLIVVVAEWLMHDAPDVARFGQVERRVHSLLTQGTVVQDLVQKYWAKSIDSRVDNLSRSPQSLPELGFYQAVTRETDLFAENRVGFDYASLEMDDDVGETGGIKNSKTRVRQVRRFMLKYHQRYSTMTVSVQAHCGTGAPPGIAPRFSAARGHYVASCLVNGVDSDSDGDEYIIHYFEDDNGRIIVQFGSEEDDDSDNDSDDSTRTESSASILRSRIEVNAWGRRVAQAVRTCTHPHGELAREGKGWVEIYLRLGDLELPRKPDYYDDRHNVIPISPVHTG